MIALHMHIFYFSFAPSNMVKKFQFLRAYFTLNVLIKFFVHNGVEAILNIRVKVASITMQF